MARSLFDLEARLPIEKTSREFRDLLDNKAFTAARRLMDEIFASFPDVDGNFRKEFQTAGFSPRVFELVLCAALREQGHQIDRSNTAPDFVTGGKHPVAIEATTTNPPQGLSRGEEDVVAAVRQLIPDDLAAAEEEFVIQAGNAIRKKC